ncbi:NRT1/ PTR family protein 3.1 [Tanacetum coccineum]
MLMTQATNQFTNFSGTASLTPLLGAFIADSFAGQFWTITVASIIYQIGMVFLTLSVVLPILRPPPCDDDEICQEANKGQVAISIPFMRLVQVCVAAYKKRDPHMISDPNLLYDDDELDASISASGKLLRT